METILGRWVPCTLAQTLILGGHGHTKPLCAISELLVPPICVVLPGVEMEGYTEPERRGSAAHRARLCGVWYLVRGAALGHYTLCRSR